MSEFIKVGEKIVNKPTGLDYDLINGKVYNLKWDRYNGMSYFEEDGLLSLPAKVYTTKSDDVFIKRVNTYFQKTSKLSTGVMLSGIKGTGKTVMAKVIAKNSNLPIIVVDEDYPTSRINDFFRKFETPVTIIFDEVDKHWDTEDLLGWLDGVQTNAKKLVLFTCNNEDRVNDYLKDRCSRVRYIRHFEANDNARFLREILRDKGIAEDKIKDTYTFIVNNFGLLSIDNILSFIDEKLLFPELSNEEIFNDMNISSKKGKKNIIGETPDEEDEDDDDWLYDDDEEYEEDESLHKINVCYCN
ncbi:MAG: DnaA protein [Bacteriophage sp.]|nr:MAG: DnaA protein [Bacteriophage sp.]